jgi:non-homologous end joining protein Ku
MDKVAIGRVVLTSRKAPPTRENVVDLMDALKRSTGYRKLHGPKPACRLELEGLIPNPYGPP